MKRAFTLIELLVVIAIMGLLGTLSVGGYRLMQRGMEDKSALQNASQFIRSAYQRAQIDRAPVAVYYWNETTKEETEDDILLVHGHAVAVRRAGRLTKVTGSGKGAKLCDEFGDLSFNRLVVNEDDDEVSSDSGSTRAGNGVYLYRLNGDETSNSKIPRSVVSQTTKKWPIKGEPLLLGGQLDLENMYAYVLMDENGVTWDVGDAYGFEFASIDLPNGYIFGPTYSRALSNPIAGEGVLRFKVSANSGSGASQGIDGASTVAIYCLRPGSSGTIDAQSIGTTDNPATRLQN